MEADLLQKALDTGKSLAARQDSPDLQPYAIVPDGYQLQSLEHLKLSPTRIKQTVKVLDPESFIKYFTDFNNEHSRVFVDIQAPAILGIIDYHVAPQGEARTPQATWGQHQLQYTFRPTVEWKRWSDMNGKQMTQAQFAQFVEDNLPDIVEPSSAAISEISRTLEVKKSVNFSSDTRLDNGQVQFNYEEEIRGTASRGTLEIPQTFVLGIAPYQGTPAYKVTARLRYKLHENKLAMWYDLVRPHKILEDAVNDVVSTIKAGLNEGTITFGSL